MIYPYMTLNDGTEITYSDIVVINDVECVKIYAERPAIGGFDSIECTLPDYRTWKCEGFSEVEEYHIKDIITKGAHLFYKFAKEGGTKELASVV